MSTAAPGRRRAEVVGSLLRPAYLHAAIERHAAGEIDTDALRAAQERAVLDAIALQESSGIDVIADGEMRRTGWTDPITRGLAGYTRDSAPAIFTDSAARPEARPRLPAVTARLSLRENVPLQEASFLRQHAHRPFKVTMSAISHASVLWVPGVSEGAYAERAEYLQDVARLAREIVAQVVPLGVDYVQLDAPRYTHLVSEDGLANFRRLGIDPTTWLDEMVALDNSLIEAFPNVTFAMHLCRGNARSMWSVEGGYDAIAERLFNTLGVQRLLLEYDTPRAGTFAPLRFVPPNKSVVLGLITTKESTVESDDAVKRRIAEASQYVPLERLALSPQCGFASVQAGNLITEEAQRAKLELIGRVARDVWT